MSSSLQTNQNLLNRLSKVEGPDATYQPQSNPLVFDKADGSSIFDVEGRRYVDLCAGFGSLSLGHNPLVMRKIFAEMASESPATMVQGMGDVYPHIDKIELLELLIAHTPEHLTHGLLGISGGQAIEIAMKTAMLATGQSRFLAFESGYHGLDFGALQLTHGVFFHEGFDGWSNTLPIKQTDHLPYHCPLEKIEQHINQCAKGDQAFAAVFVEPVQGRGGIHPAHLEWLRGLKDICQKHGVLLVLDEVFSGMGRSGSLTIADECKADMTCFGKALGGGMPISVCLGTEKVMYKWPKSQGEARHTGTFFGHPLSCRIAKNVVDELISKDLPTRAKVLGQKAVKWLTQKFSETNPTIKVRGKGLMIAIDLGQDGAGAELMDQLRGGGIIALAGGKNGSCLQLSPALNIDEKVFTTALEEIAVYVAASEI